jgi:multimeric flavodoxin WrbA
LLAIGISASPRVGANTATAVADVLLGAAQAQPELDAIELTLNGIAPIGDCTACAARGVCTISDPFDALMDQVTRADLLVLGTPLYWYGPSAQLKAFLDRWSCRLDLQESQFRAAMHAKRVVLVVAQGERGFYEASPYLQMMDWTLRYLDMVVAGRVTVVGHARGDYAADPKQRELVRAAGQAAVRGESADVMPPWFHVAHHPGDPLGSRPADPSP